MAKIERKYMAHYIDAALPGASGGGRFTCGWARTWRNTWPK